MKFITSTILLIIFLTGCKEKEQKIVSEFTEEDAYEIVNTYLIAELNERDADSIIYWNNRKLIEPDYRHTKIENKYAQYGIQPPAPYPIFSSEYWDTGKIKGITVIEWKEYNSFFIENDSINLEELWNSKFNGEYLHNISYPIYNPETKIAVIEDYEYKPFMYCGTDLNNLYYYKKTKNGWTKFK